MRTINDFELLTEFYITCRLRHIEERFI